MSRAVPKIGQKAGDLQFKAVENRAEFCTWRFFLSWHIDRLLVDATVTYLRANLLHFNVFKISKHCLKRTIGLNIKVCTRCGIMLLGSKSVAL